METLEDGSIHSKGKPLRCLACGGSLLLNSRTFQQHLNSKRHKKTSDSWNKDDVFEFASGRNNEKVALEDGETHEERFMRAKATAEKNALEEKKRLKGPRKGGHRKRPGKRQRRALKET